MADYSEILCKAVDTIVKQRLEGISFDQTILCTVIDDSLREQGIYTVTNNGGTTKFNAVSSITTYRKNNNVYVQIPGGDWNQQKIIIGKKNDKIEEPYIYTSPFSQLVDISGNLINSVIPAKETGLVANGDIESIPLWGYNLESSDTIYSEKGKVHSGYTRLGISAGFRSWLNPFYTEDDGISRQVIKGEYGLHLIIQTEEDSTTNEESTKTQVYDLYLNCADMNGNPYNFESFYVQQKVFDVSAIGKIKSLKLEFYQNAGSFQDVEGKLIPSKDFLGNSIEPNLFANDIYITLGYDVSEFDEELVQIYTLDSTTYSATINDPTTNHKNISLRWIHKFNNDIFQSVNENDNLQYNVYWYRYELGHSSADNYSGVYWKYLSTQSFDKDGNIIYQVEDEIWKKYSGEVQRAPSFFSTWLLPDTTMAEERVKAIIVYNGKPYRSNILTFTNDNTVIDKGTIEAIQALSIDCVDNSYGNYRIYNLGNSLIDQAQSKIVRTWKPMFKSFNGNVDSLPAELIEAESIEWIIPTEKTMIVIDNSFTAGADIVDRTSDPGFIHIIRYCEKDGSLKNGRNLQQYRIRGYYSQDYSNNTIQCKVVKEKITYTAIKELTFGPAGTTGTDVTLVLDFEDGAAAVNLGLNKAVKVRARLYDYENKEITNLSNYTINWDWKTKNSDINGLNNLFSINRINNTIVEIHKNTSIIGNNYHILQATVTDFGDYDLTAYLPIPISSNSNYTFISGTTQVVYETSGEVMDYFQNPYRLYNKNGKVINGVKWKCVNGISGEGNYTPKINTSEKNGIYTYRLSPLNVYVENTCKYVCVNALINENIVWSQPILILQNHYPSAMINKWNGDLIIDKEQNSILTAKIAAGRKENDDNTFTGLMLGDWGTAESEAGLGKTGLFGFNKGKQSFAFKDDGTAFIGIDGEGRIEFNGSKGTIESSGYDTGNGISINLSDSTIEAKKLQSTIFKLSKDNPYLIINSAKSRNTDTSHTLLNIGTDNYYLKSKNYSTDIYNEDATTGTFIDLNNGNIFIQNGTFYGDISLNPGKGMRYVEYGAVWNETLEQWSVAPTGYTNTVNTISLKTLLAELKSTDSKLMALSTVNNKIAEKANKAAKDAGDAAEKAQTAVDGLAAKLDKIYKFDDNSSASINYKAMGLTEVGGQQINTFGISIIGNGTELRVTNAGIDLGGMMYLTPSNIGLKGWYFGLENKYYPLSFELV